MCDARLLVGGRDEIAKEWFEFCSPRWDFLLGFSKDAKKTNSSEEFFRC